MELKLKCYAQRYGQRWQAVCVDLDIAADGESFANAKESLATCIELYLEAVAESPPEEHARLLSRRSPLHVRFKFTVLTMLTGFRHRNAFSRKFIVHPHVPVSV